MEIKTMEDVLSFLKANKLGAFATIEDGKPKVRPWSFMLEENSKIYFCTANNKDVFKQLQKTPFMEFSATSKDMVTVRLSGEVIFTDDMNIKTEILEDNPMVKGIYHSADNPVFEAFYIEHGEAIIFDFSGQPPKKLNF